MKRIWRLWIKGSTEYYEYVDSGPFYAAIRFFKDLKVSKDAIICVEQPLSNTLRRLNPKAFDFPQSHLCYPIYEYNYTQIKEYLK